MFGLGFITKIVGFFAGGGGKGIASELRAAHKNVLDAKNDKSRLEAKERSEALMLRLEAQTRGSTTWMPKMARALFALPFIAYNAKLIVYDKMMGMGATDGLSPELYKIEMIVVGFYFLDATLQKMRS